MKILVTGARGFVGKAIVSEITKLKFEVYELVNLTSTSKLSVNEKNKKNVFQADITDYRSLRDAVKIERIDVLIHAAGLAHQFGKMEQESFQKVNVLGAENAAKLAIWLKAKHFILISSVSVYGHQEIKGLNSNSIGEIGISETADCRPQGFYAQSKLDAENVVRRICEANQIALTILRLATVIGEDDRGNVMRLINSINNKRFIWIGEGENLKSLIYKGDIAKACVKLLSKTSGIEIFNITGDTLKMKEIVSEISFNLNKKIPKFSVSPKLLEKIFQINSKFLKIRKIENIAATTKKWLSDDVFSGAKFEKDYDFKTETPIKEAIRRQVQSFKNNKNS